MTDFPPHNMTLQFSEGGGHTMLFASQRCSYESFLLTKENKTKRSLSKSAQEMLCVPTARLRV